MAAVEVLPRSPAVPEELRRRELGAFLRSRRERLTPMFVGLPAGGRRRTPGLRREEVAQLAGVGVTWYTWLEQGRDIKASEQVLDAIARALHLEQHERSHLYSLAGAPSVSAAQESEDIAGHIRLILDQLAPFPSSLLNGRFDILAHNRAFAGLVGDVDGLEVAERNQLWLLFACQAWRDLILTWSTGAHRCVAMYRAAFADHVGEPAWKCLPKRLSDVSPEFAELWGRHEVAAPDAVVKQFLHPDLGLMKFTTSSMWLRPGGELRMVVYTPADEATAGLTEKLMEITPAPLSVPLR